MTKQELAILINDFRWGRTKKGLEDLVDYIFDSLTTKPVLKRLEIGDNYSAGARVYGLKHLSTNKTYFILNPYETPPDVKICNFNSIGSSFSGNRANFTDMKTKDLVEIHEEDVQLNKITIYEAELG